METEGETVTKILERDQKKKKRKSRREEMQQRRMKREGKSERKTKRKREGGIHGEGVRERRSVGEERDEERFGWKAVMSEGCCTGKNEKMKKTIIGGGASTGMDNQKIAHTRINWRDVSRRRRRSLARKQKQKKIRIGEGQGSV